VPAVVEGREPVKGRHWPGATKQSGEYPNPRWEFPGKLGES